MLKHKNFLIVYKVLFGLLALSAVATELVMVAQRGTFNPVNFFSYFTVENNILAGAALLISAWALTANRHFKWLDALRGLSTVFILVVGIGFAVLLSGIEGVILTAVPWDNIVMHYIMPVAMLVDYLIDRPKTKFKFSSSLWWLLFPIAYVAYSLVRGELSGWYPYPFLNLETNGWSGVIVTVLGLTVLSLVLIFGTVKLSGKKR